MSKPSTSNSRQDATRLMLLSVTALIVVGGVIAIGLRAEDNARRPQSASVTLPADGATSSAPSRSDAEPQTTTGASAEQPDPTAPQPTSPPPVTQSNTDGSAPLSPSVPDCVALAEFTSAAASVSSFENDINDDGVRDEVTVYLDPDTLIWRLRVEFATDLGSDIAISEAGSGSKASALGSFDINRDGPKEIFIRNGAEPQSFFVELFGSSNCDLAPVLLVGEPAIFPISSQNDDLAGLSCKEGLLLRKYATRSGASVSFGGGTETFSLSTGVLSSVGTVLTTRNTTGALALATIDCLGVPDS